MSDNKQQNTPENVKQGQKPREKNTPSSGSKTAKSPQEQSKQSPQSASKPGAESTPTKWQNKQPPDSVTPLKGSPSSSKSYTSTKSYNSSSVDSTADWEEIYKRPVEAGGSTGSLVDVTHEAATEPYEDLEGKQNVPEAESGKPFKELMSDKQFDDSD